ncbi:MAG: hypothetical protein J1F29_03420, partial [Lentimicrobiaceae bacterium]|nr:hypothetical protein [Lentimicrobiaceae bacterium]
MKTSDRLDIRKWLIAGLCFAGVAAGSATVARLSSLRSEESVENAVFVLSEPGLLPNLYTEPPVFYSEEVLSSPQTEESDNLLLEALAPEYPAFPEDALPGDFPEEEEEEGPFFGGIGSAHSTEINRINKPAGTFLGGIG